MNTFGDEGAHPFNLITFKSFKKMKNYLIERLNGSVKSLLLGSMLVCSSTISAQAIYTPGGNIGTISNGTNSIGIGTSAPTSTTILDVNGNAYFRGQFGVKTLGSTFYTISTKQPISPVIAGLLGNKSGLFVGMNFSNQRIVSISSASNGSPYFNLFNNTGSTEVVRITSEGETFFNGGNVGIGTTAPTAKLHVNGATVMGSGTFTLNKVNAQGTPYQLYVKGGIISEEVKVELANGNWADYVFKKSYALMPLEDVEQFIEENGHLHNMPSASEIEKDGLELKRATILQQEKIEELYLHMIEMKKEINDLKQENSKLKQQLNVTK